MSGEFLALLVLNPDGTPLRLNRVRAGGLLKRNFLHLSWPVSHCVIRLTIMLNGPDR